MDLYGGFLNHFGAIMGVPPDHPFSWGFSMKFHEKKHPAIGDLPFLGTPYGQL